MLIGAVILLIAGIIYIAAPETGWKISKGWQFQNTEPSDAALVWARISGAVMVLVAVVLFVKFARGG